MKAQLIFCFLSIIIGVSSCNSINSNNRLTPAIEEKYIVYVYKKGDNVLYKHNGKEFKDIFLYLGKINSRGEELYIKYESSNELVSLIDLLNAIMTTKAPYKKKKDIIEYLKAIYPFSKKELPRLYYSSNRYRVNLTVYGVTKENEIDGIIDKLGKEQDKEGWIKIVISFYDKELPDKKLLKNVVIESKNSPKTEVPNIRRIPYYKSKTEAELKQASPQSTIR